MKINATTLRQIGRLIYSNGGGYHVRHRYLEYFSGKFGQEHCLNQERQLAEASGSTMAWIKSMNCGS